jgi:hypothetical protein
MIICVWTSDFRNSHKLPPRYQVPSSMRRAAALAGFFTFTLVPSALGLAGGISALARFPTDGAGPPPEKYQYLVLVAASGGLYVGTTLLRQDVGHHGWDKPSLAVLKSFRCDGSKLEPDGLEIRAAKFALREGR